MTETIAVPTLVVTGNYVVFVFDFVAQIKAQIPVIWDVLWGYLVAVWDFMSPHVIAFWVAVSPYLEKLWDDILHYSILLWTAALPYLRAAYKWLQQLIK